eukprot:TRINITY_DN1218_c1_g1_i1.p1 TRINITY_DN1218_c1_g1~~TRINITY_DN1218_c1_g1_i1.p1  ORF type:complete len:385 (+),score=84.20 TRINITY_DN1218_c1_g1_i1:2-1156(+)
MKNLHDADDMLAKGILGADTSFLPNDLKAIFFAEAAAQGYNGGGGAGGEKTATKKGKQTKGEEKKNKEAKVTARGTRTVPVYIFSILGGGSDLLIDKHHLMASTADAVVVIQSNQTELAVPYFMGKNTISLDGSRVSRHIIAGLATSIGGIVPPMLRYSPVHDSVMYDYTWAMGAHPWGHFTGSDYISQIFLDAGIRNSVLSHVHNAARMMRQAIDQVDDFSREYVYDAFGEDHNDGDGVNFSRNNNNKNIFDVLYVTEGESLSNVAQLTLYKLNASMTNLHNQFMTVAQHLSSHQYNNAVRAATSLQVNAAQFRDYVESEVHHARVSLLCCTVRQIIPGGAGGIYHNDDTIHIILMLFIMSTGLVMAAILNKRANRIRAQLHQ